MTETRRVLFVCQHGAAKSVIAATYLQRFAGARGLSIECASAGLDPDDSIPPHVLEGLRDDGVESPPSRPNRLTVNALHSADIVVSLGCDLSSVGAPPKTLVTWEGVPAVSDGFVAARDDIARRLQDLLDELQREPREQG